MCHLFCHYLFLISPSFRASGRPYFVIVAFSGYPLIFRQRTIALSVKTSIYLFQVL